MQRLGTAFNGFTIEARDGSVGRVSDFLFQDESWVLRWLVVDTGGWLHGRKILIHPSSLDKPDVDGRAFETSLTKAQVEASPEIGQDEPVSLQMEKGLYGYYGYDPLWGGGFYGFSQLATGAAIPPAPGGDAHLRSMAELRHYDIHAVDGEVGHLADFLFDDESWKIDYIIVDTKNWWLGKHVVVAPASIQEVNWAQRFVRLDLTCYKIKGSPPWVQTSLVDRAYESLLQAYYGWGSTKAVQPKPVPVTTRVPN
jgi:hypothetical protein